MRRICGVFGFCRCYKRPIDTNKPPPKKKEMEALAVNETVVSKILSVKVNFWDQRSDVAKFVRISPETERTRGNLP